MDWVALIVQMIVSIVLIAPVLWIAGRWLAGKDKATLTDSIWIVVLGVVIGTLIGGWLVGWLAWLGVLIMFVLWLGLVKHFFDCGWIHAFVISIVANIVYIVIWAILEFVLELFGITVPPIVPMLLLM